MLEDGVWRTVGGRKIFIRDGQALSDAMKASGKFKKNKKTTNRKIFYNCGLLQCFDAISTILNVCLCLGQKGARAFSK